MPRTRYPKQLELHLPTWGGRRRRAGRPKTGRTTIPHRARPEITPDHPIHVTLRLGTRFRNLRERATATVLGAAFFDGCGRGPGRVRDVFRLVHFSVQPTHLHLLVEADDLRALARGMQGLSVRIARRLNKLFRRRGTVFAERYHARVLRAPRDVRATLVYVLQNARHHRSTGALAPGTPWVDGLSSARFFDGWTSDLRPDWFKQAPHDAPVVPARSWLLRKGWRRHALIDPREGPREGPATPATPLQGR